MMWTKDKPTEPGWYWWRRYKNKKQYRVEVRQRRHQLEAWYDGERCADLNENVNGEWQGPIVPEEGK